MEFRRVKAKVRGPFLVVAPLTTLGHWRREIETWTDMNVVCFMGSAADRQLIVDHELWYREVARSGGRLGRKTMVPKFEVMLTSFEILRDAGNIFGTFAWDMAIVDEAHRLKALHSATRCVKHHPGVSTGSLQSCLHMLRFLQLSVHLYCVSRWMAVITRC